MVRLARPNSTHSMRESVHVYVYMCLHVSVLANDCERASVYIHTSQRLLFDIWMCGNGLDCCVDAGNNFQWS